MKYKVVILTNFIDFTKKNKLSDSFSFFAKIFELQICMKSAITKSNQISRTNPTTNEQRRYIDIHGLEDTKDPSGLMHFSCLHSPSLAMRIGFIEA